MKKKCFVLVMLMLMGSMVSADLVVQDSGVNAVTRYTDAGLVVWSNTAGSRSTGDMTVNADGTLLFAARQGTDRMLATRDAADGTWYDDRFNSGTHTVDSAWGPDYNGDGKIDLYVSSRDTFYVVDVDQTNISNVSYNTLATWNVADVTGSDGTGGHLYFANGNMYSTKGGNVSPGNRISVWDPLTGANIATYTADECKGINDMILGPDQNGDGIEDLWVADAYRNSIRAYDSTDGTYIDTVDMGLTMRSPQDILEAPDGTIYVATRFATSLSAGALGSAWGNVVKYDPTTGTSTLFLDTEGANYQGLEYVVPEPATLALLGLGSLVVTRRKRK